MGQPTYALVIPTVGASGAIYGLLLAYSLTWPDRTIMLIFPPVAFKAIWLIPRDVLHDDLIFGGGNVSHVGHLGGVLVGWLYMRRRGDGGREALQPRPAEGDRWRRYQHAQAAARPSSTRTSTARRNRDRSDRKFH